MTVSCNTDILNNYTFTLLQRDYCEESLDSSQIMITNDDIDDIVNTLISISVNVQSLILKSTWSISVQVSNRLGNDGTTYTNITDTGNLLLLYCVVIVILLDNDIYNCQSSTCEQCEYIIIIIIIIIIIVIIVLQLVH